MKDVNGGVKNNMRIVGPNCIRVELGTNMGILPGVSDLLLEEQR